MQDNDRILIAGGGIAGSMLALVLGRAGCEVVVVDPRRSPPPVFRNEKLGHEQIALLRRLEALSCFEAACWPAAGEPGAYPPEARPGLTDCGAPHHLWIRNVRAAWPETVRFVQGSVAEARLSEAGQTVVTAKGERLDGRLLVLTTGRSTALHDQLGLERRLLSDRHSVCIGFSVTGVDPTAEIIAAPRGAGLGYVSLFPMPGELRVNVFSYRDLTDPWTRRMRADPVAALAELVPATRARLAGAEVVRAAEARGTDLYATDGVLRPGLVLIGDAFHAPCPASGTGMLRILNDIDRLTETYLPEWLETPGMSADKIAAFYADPVKRRIDAASLKSSIAGRGAAVGSGPYWRARRVLKTLKGLVATPRRAPRVAPLRRTG